MRFSVLGPLQVEDEGQGLRLGGPRQRAVLALLVADARRVVSTDRIVTEIWGDQPPDGARDSLYTYVSNLRRMLGKERIVRDGAGYRLDVLDGDAIDAAVFEVETAAARRLIGSDPGRARDMFDVALAGWRGRPYESFVDLDSIRPEQQRLELLQLAALEDRIDAQLHAGETPSVGDVEDLCGRHPLRERLWGLLARSQYRAGLQADSLRTFTRLRTTLGEELGIEPSPAVVRLEEQILLQDPGLEPQAAAPPSTLPTPVSSFVGRVDELTLLDKSIHENRLITVLGPGGAGKTRIAVEAAWNVAGSFPDGVWLADLAQVLEADAAPQAVAAAVQVPARPDPDVVAAIAAHLCPRTALLVLDNCEHVLGAAADLAVTLLEGAPDVTIVATSRQALDREGEVRFPIAGLAMASPEGPPGDAERLFEQRAAGVRAGFSLDASNRPAVSSICRRLDGMPLAIELAAARSDTLSPLEIDRLLTDRFALLADHEQHRQVHRTLRGSLDWSYDLLPAESRRAFDLLGVFEGPFSADAAASVLGKESAVETAGELRALVRASMVHVESSPPGLTLYRLLETVRVYTREHLRENGLWDAAIARHDTHYYEACRDARGAFFGRERVEAQRQMELELTDHRAAFDRVLASGAAEQAHAMGWPLGHVWVFTGRIAEGEQRLQAVLAASVGSESQSRADCLAAASWAMMFRQDFARAIAWTDEAIAIYRQGDDGQGLAYALARRGHIAFSVGDGPTAMQMLQESLALCREIGYDDGTAWPITLLAQARRWSGDESPEIRDMLEAGRERFIAMGEIYGQVHADMLLTSLVDEGHEYRLSRSEEMVRLGEEPGADRLIRAIAFHSHAYLIWESGELDRAQGLNRAAARAALETGAIVNSGLALLQAAIFAGRRGDAVSAATFFGAGDTHFAMQQAPFMKRMAQPVIEEAKASLGDERYEELYDTGARTTVEEATRLVLARH